MPHKSKINPEKRFEIVKRWLSDEITQSEASRIVRVRETSIREWISLYRAECASALNSQGRNRRYSLELKQLVYCMVDIKPTYGLIKTGNDSS